MKTLFKISIIALFCTFSFFTDVLKPPNRNTQVDVTDRQTNCNGISSSKLAGQSICLRFYIGGNTIYAFTTK